MPRRWVEINTVTIAFGHGLSVAPLQAMMAFGALMNGGHLIPPTFLKRSEQEAMALAKPVIKPETSEKMRYLMRLNVEKGTATRADVKGYYVGGKTGTSEKVVGGRYSKTKVLTAFTAVLPADRPRYALLIMLDEPQPTPETHGYATSGWNAVPVGGTVIARIAPLLGVCAALRSADLRQADPGEHGRAVNFSAPLARSLSLAYEDFEGVGFVGWVGASETHQSLSRNADGFRVSLNPSYNGERERIAIAAPSQVLIPEKFDETLINVIGHLLRNIVTARHGVGVHDIAGVFPPDRRKLARSFRRLPARAP